jgi:galactose oxidase
MHYANAPTLFFAAFLFHTTNAINACPGADTLFTGSEGIRYRVCPGTDLTGRSAKVTQNVASVNACAQLCDKNMDCFKAVYDHQWKSCHFKELTGLNWVANDRFETIQAEQINIARCPSDESTLTSSGVSIRNLIPESGTRLTDVSEKIQDLPRHRRARPKHTNH